MYSVVLMAALTTGGSAPDCWFSHCHTQSSCSGCFGGYACSGCTGWNCAGGYGAYYGGCYGSAWSCGGSFGCYGATWGGGGVDYNCFGCHGCYGCYGSFGCTGYNPAGGPMGQGAEPIPPPKAEDIKKGTSGGSGGDNSGIRTPDRAKVIVQLPADAKLYVDDQPIKAAEGQAFSTPRLERGQTYYYEVRAEAVRDGKKVVDSKRILVRAGEEVTVAFPKLAEKEDVAVVAPNAKR